MTSNDSAKRLHRKFQPVFTPVGTGVLIVSLFILIRSLLNRNSYEIVLSFGLLFFLLIVGIIGLWKSHKLKYIEPIWKPPFPLTAASDEKAQISGLDENIPFFFRMHFLVKGRFFPNGHGFLNSKTGKSKKNWSPFFAETSIRFRETSGQVPFDFPMSGIFHGEGYCQLRDIFGFFNFSCGSSQCRTVNVRCAPCWGKKIIINAQTGADDRRNKPAPDIERYYMREYTPGDRFRDINWKSSEKIDALITRISTDTQEKINRIEVHLRNFCKEENITLEALWLLDRAKAQLLYFIRNLMEQGSLFIFDVHTAQGEKEIENQNDLDIFSEELCGLSFFPPQNETGFLKGTGEIYMFSTACDIGLPSFLLSNNHRPCSLFMIQPATEPLFKKTKKKSDETEVIHIRDFDLKNCRSNINWFFQKKINPLSFQNNRTMLFYAELKL